MRHGRLVAALGVGAIATLLGAAAAPAAGELASPLMQQRGQHPLNAAFGLPAVAARTVPAAEWQVAVEHANSFMGGVRGREVLLLDGESTELVVRHRRRLNACWQGEAVLPFVAHTSGWADRAIDDWHQAFGLPDAERDTFPLFDLNYVWQDAEGRRRELVEPVAGLGDVHVAAQRRLGCRGGARGIGGGTAAIARVGLKLPTGDADSLLGSGAADVYADLQSPVRTLGRRGSVAATLGALAVGDSELFADQRPVVLYGAVGGAFRWHPRWHALVQLDWHTPFHDSALRELGEPAASLGVGIRHLAAGAAFEFSIAEDALIDTAPDITARLSWTWRPRRPLPPAPVSRR